HSVATRCLTATRFKLFTRLCRFSTVLSHILCHFSQGRTRKVLDHVLEVKNQGVSVIIISHNIYHVYEVSDRIVVLDHGRKILDVRKEEVTPEDVIEVIRKGEPLQKAGS
ncbi:MAG: hypothetical protein ACP5PL_06080, partial [Infirmifilum sp.]